MTQIHNYFPWAVVNDLIDAAVIHAVKTSYVVHENGGVWYMDNGELESFSAEGVNVNVWAGTHKADLHTVVVPWAVFDHHYNKVNGSYRFMDIPEDIKKKLTADISAILKKQEDDRVLANLSAAKEERRKQWEELNKEFAPKGCTIYE